MGLTRVKMVTFARSLCVGGEEGTGGDNLTLRLFHPDSIPDTRLTFSTRKRVFVSNIKSGVYQIILPLFVNSTKVETSSIHFITISAEGGRSWEGEVV